LMLTTKPTPHESCSFCGSYKPWAAGKSVTRPSTTPHLRTAKSPSLRSQPGCPKSRHGTVSPRHTDGPRGPLFGPRDPRNTIQHYERSAAGWRKKDSRSGSDFWPFPSRDCILKAFGCLTATALRQFGIAILAGRAGARCPAGACPDTMAVLVMHRERRRPSGGFAGAAGGRRETCSTWRSPAH
jgi:hypothetical protein